MNRRIIDPPGDYPSWECDNISRLQSQSVSDYLSNTNTNSNSNSNSDWTSILPVDIVFVILDNLLEPIDHVRFAAICKRWRSLAKQYNHVTPRWNKALSPMLMILPKNILEQPLIFSLLEGRIYDKIINIKWPIIALSCGQGPTPFYQSFWTSIEEWNEGYSITDAIFYKARVYAVDTNFGRIVSLDVGGSTKIHNTPNLPPSHFPPSKCSQSYLVKSTRGELLHVRRFLNLELDENEMRLPWTRDFKVYKLVFDEDGSVVEQVELTSTGDETLFIGNGLSASGMSSTISRCRPNSIYYTSHSIKNGSYHNSEDTGIFNLDKRATTPIQQSYPESSLNSHDGEAIWIWPQFEGPALYFYH